jgi:hypothetical protein
MKTAVIHISSDKTLSAVITFEVAQASIEFHENFFPRQILFLSQKHYEFVNVPRTVCNVLGDYRSMKIDEYLCLWAHHPISLALGEE